MLEPEPEPERERPAFVSPPMPMPPPPPPPPRPLRSPPRLLRSSPSRATDDVAANASGERERWSSSSPNARCALWRALTALGRYAHTVVQDVHLSDGYDAWLATSVAVAAAHSPMRSARTARASPTSVIIADTPSFARVGAAGPPRIAAIELHAQALSYVYSALTRSRAWDTTFERGPLRVHGDRRLATAYLSEPAVDGWNVVFGALELARVWVADESCPRKVVGDDAPLHRRDRDARARLAACLSVSWKFQRSMSSRFPHKFLDFGAAHGWPDLAQGHTRELGNVAYAFLFDHEQAEFGNFCAENTERCSELYNQILELEVELLRKVAVFPLLAENVQVRAEARLGALCDTGALSSAASMAARVVVPFFVRAAVTSPALYEVLVEGGGDEAGDECGDEALACVGCACVCVATTIPAREDGDAHRHHCHFPPRFSAAAKRLALRLVQAALCATSSAYLRHGCYGDPGWEFHAMVSDTSLSLARTALRSAGAR